MKILIFGSGGREHALAWAAARNPRVTELVCAPGNGGMAKLARLVPVALSDLDALIAVATQEQPDLTIVGPELPLSLGLVDALEARGLRVFGPTKAAAMLETSKSFAKRFLQRHNIPTANYAVCTSVADVEKSIELFHAPIVVKADGLAAGKGVIICQSRRAALEAAQGLFSGKLIGSEEQQIIIEEFLAGEEVSFLCLCDGQTVVPLVPAQDHKRIGEGDTGLNTGGMGTYCPTPFLTDEQLADATKKILDPFMRGCVEEGIDYRGILYPGIMLTKDGPKVLEFNARFGDPETQVYLTRLEDDLVELLEASVSGNLKNMELEWVLSASVCVVMASGGYPGSYPKGKVITGIEAANALPGTKVFHAGTALKDGQIVTNGGRVLGVTALGRDLKSAQAAAYAAVEKIQFEGAQFRRDIAARAISS